MADVTLTYKGATIGELSESGNKTLKTAGKYCDADILLEYVRPAEANIWTLEATAQDERALSTSYDSANGAYIRSGSSYKQFQTAYYIPADGKKAYKIVPTASANTACWGVTDAGIAQMENQGTLSGGNNVDPTTAQYLDSQWVDSATLFFANFGVKKLAFQQRYGGFGTPPFKVYSATVDDLALQLLPDGYSVHKIVYPNEINIGTLTQTYPYVLSSNRQRASYSELVTFQPGYEYIMLNPSGRNCAVWFLTDAGLEAYNSQNSINGKYNDSGWQGNGYTFTVSTERKGLIQMNNTVFNMAGFFLIGKKAVEV